MDVVPNSGAGGLGFGLSPADVQDLWGSPMSSTRSRLGEVVLRFPDARLTFDHLGLAEIGLTPESDPVVSGRRPLSSRVHFEQLVREDGAAGELLGFIVLPNLGLTITGVHDGDHSQLAMSVFRRGRWDAFKDQMKPFELSE